MNIPPLFWEVWPYLTGLLALAASIAAAGHVVLYKRDPRSATGWLAVILFFPLMGAVLYFLLGINRIARRASRLRGKVARAHRSQPAVSAAVEQILSPEFHTVYTLAAMAGRITRRPLLAGNAIEPYINGDEAYPHMLRAIDGAEKSITLCTYLFGNDEAGDMFITAFAAAIARGVRVRVLIDAVGLRYSFPSVKGRLRRAGVQVALFNPTLMPGWPQYMNLRCHRKILVVDGRIGFTGGMNIRRDNLVRTAPKHPVQDVHFHISGPAVSHLQEAFVEDWLFSTGEALDGEEFFPPLDSTGQVILRGITDGPDEDYDKLRLLLLGALACSRDSVRIATPYFLPDPTVISALTVAAMRGVKVDIVLPEINNFKTVAWATRAMLWQVLQRGCRVYMTKEPFDHSKLMVVDGVWSLIGSANWDSRSLRLNFEFNVECYSESFADRINGIIEHKLEGARRVTLEELNGRPLQERLRDGVARLLTPYL